MYFINVFGISVLAVLSLFAMAHIQRNSKELEKLGIFANEKLFRLYSVLWIVASLAMLGQAISYKIQPDEVIAAQKQALSYAVFGLFSWWSNLSLNMTILLTYLKFSDRLERTTVEAAKQELRQ